MEHRGRRRTLATIARLTQPDLVIERGSITALLDTGAVVTRGGGGAAVTENSDGHLPGVKAVVHKDLVAAIRGIAVDARRSSC